MRTSRSTVGTMTEINDHLKLLFARAARLYCRHCGRAVRRDNAQSIADELEQRAAELRDALLLVCFPVPLPPKMKPAELRAELAKLGYVRFHREEPKLLTVIQDRLRLSTADRSRLVEALEAALRSGHGRVSIHALGTDGAEREVAAVLERPALCRLRSALSGRHAGPVLLQLARRRLRYLPRLRPRDRHRLRTGHPRQQQVAGGRRHPAVANALL